MTQRDTLQGRRDFLRASGALGLAAMLQQWRVAPLNGAATTIAFSPSVTLRPKGPVRLRVERR